MRLNKVELEKETLQDAMEQFLKFKTAQQKSERTLQDYKRFLYKFLEFSSNSLNEEILTAEVEEFFTLIPNTSPAVYNHPYQNICSFFNWAVSRGKLAKNPIIALGLQKKRDDGNIKPVNIEDIKTLLKSFDKTTFTGLRNYTITLLMLDTGIRTSELRRLKDSDFDAEAKQIMVSKLISKTKKHRILYLSDTTARQLAKYIKVKPEGWSELIFPTREGAEMTCNGMAREFDRQCKKTGVKFTPYQLRHTFATYFVANGGNIFTLQDLMGHSDIRMTKRYTEIDEKQKRTAHNQYSPINALKGAERIVNI